VASMLNFVTCSYEKVAAYVVLFFCILHRHYNFFVCAIEIAEFCDEDGVRFSMEDSRRRFPGGIVGSLHFGWKSRNNHFVSYNDLVTKGGSPVLCKFTQFERRVTSQVIFITSCHR